MPDVRVAVALHGAPPEERGSPPVAVLLFVATGIAGTTCDQTVKYCWAFILCELVVLALVLFVPALSRQIPHRFI